MVTWLSCFMVKKPYRTNPQSSAWITQFPGYCITTLRKNLSNFLREVFLGLISLYVVCCLLLLLEVMEIFAIKDKILDPQRLVP